MDNQQNCVCPKCGYCPHCGRGGYQVVPYYPYPWYPYYPWVSPFWATSTGTITVGNTAGNTTTADGTNFTYTG